MIKIRLERYETGSVITLLEDDKHISSIVYTRKIHEYESDSDFKSLTSELKTYGDTAMIELYDYLHAARQRKS